MKRFPVTVAAMFALLYGVGTPGGTNTWTETGPNASNVFVQISATPSIAFARGGDKFWKSADGGVTWTTRLSGNTESYSFALSPAHANVVVVQWSGYADIRRSIDGGDTFSFVSSLDARELKYSPNGAFLYAVAYNEPYVRRSADDGSTWSSTPNNGLPPPPPPNTGGLIPVPVAVGIHPLNPDIVYAGFRDARWPGIYKTIDGAANWIPATGLNGEFVNAIAVNPANGSMVCIATDHGLYRTVDAGVSWNKVPDPGATGVATLAMSAVAFDPDNSSIIYAGGAQRGEIFRSADGGATWELRGQGVIASQINSLAPRAGSSGQLLAGTTHTLYRTTNAGQSWTVSANGIRSSNAASLGNGSKLRVGLSDGGIYESVDGSNWTPLNNQGLRDSQPDGKFASVKSISDPGRLFVIFEGSGGMAVSTDGGSTWLPRPPSFNSLGNGSAGGFITASGTGPVHYATSYSGVEKSTDDGNNWFWASNGLPSQFPTLIAKNEDASELYVGMFTEGMFKSVDGAQNWTDLNATLTTSNSRIIRSIAYDDASRVLVIGTNDGPYVTRDGGVTFSPLTSPTPGTQASVSALLVEDFDHGAIYLGTVNRIYRSVDRGVSWTELSAGATPSVFKGVTALMGDGPGVVYVSFVPGGVDVFKVSPDMQLITTAPTPGIYALAPRCRGTSPCAITARGHRPSRGSPGRCPRTC